MFIIEELGFMKKVGGFNSDAHSCVGDNCSKRENYGNK